MRYLALVIIFLLFCVFILSCGDLERDYHKIDKTDGLIKTEAVQRFEVTSYGQFNAGYNGNNREILIIKDKETGHQYLAITGCGTTELHTEHVGKSTVQKEE